MSDYIYRCYAILLTAYRSIGFEKISFDDLDANIYEASENLLRKHPIRQIQIELDYYAENEGDAELSLSMNFFEDEGPNEVKAFINKHISVELESVCDLELIEIELDFY